MGKAETVPEMGAMMAIPRTGTDWSPPRIKQHIFSVHTAVLKGIAVFFNSTNFPLFSVDTLIHNKILHNGASAFKRVRFFNDKKEQNLTIYRSRAPPLQSRYQKNFEIGGNTVENQI